MEQRLPSVVLTCANCGNEEPEGARFCGTCGTPFAADESPLAHEPSMETSKATEMLASASTDAPTDVAPPVWPEASTSDPVSSSPSRPDDAELAHDSMEATTPLASTTPAPGPRRRISPPLLIVVLALLVAGGAVAALFGTGVIGGDSGKSETAFVKQVNENVLSPLGQADETAAGNASTAEGTFTRAADGNRIIRVADDASVYLRALSGLSAQQKGEVQLLLALVAANRGYGQAFAAFTPDNTDGEFALDSAAAGVRGAIATVESRLSASLQLPAQTAIITLRSSPSTPTTSTNATPPLPDLGAVYVRQVDGLLQQSHTVVLALRSFILRTTSGAIKRSAAVTLARSYVEQRRL